MDDDMTGLNEYLDAEDTLLRRSIEKTDIALSERVWMDTVIVRASLFRELEF